MKFWPEAEAAAFMRSREKYGKLSNMTGGFPIRINGLEFCGPEALFQALKYPESPESQRAIADAPNGMAAKRVAYLPEHSAHLREDWDEVRVSGMRITLSLKMWQHPEDFGYALAETGQLTIVEKSYRDAYWGAKPVKGGYEGENMLGRCLMDLRDKLVTSPVKNGMREYLRNDDIGGFRVNGESLSRRKKGG